MCAIHKKRTKNCSVSHKKIGNALFFWIVHIWLCIKQNCCCFPLLLLLLILPLTAASMAHLKMCLCKKVTDLSQFLIAGERSHSTSTPLTYSQSYKTPTISTDWKAKPKLHTTSFSFPFFVLLNIFPFLSSVDVCRSYFKFILKCVRRSTFQYVYIQKI